MKTISKFLVSACLMNATAAQAIDLRVDNVKIYQPASGSFSQSSSLYIENGKIVKVALASGDKQNADKVIDGKGQFAIPGLTDLHVHLGASGSNYSEFQYLPVKAHFNANLYLGVTNVVDLFSFKQTLDEAAQLKAEQVTPNLFYAGTLFTNPGGHGTQFGGQVYEIKQDADIESLWQKHVATKPMLTKAVIESFGGAGKTLTDTQLRELAKRSKEANLPFFVHVSTLADGKRAIEAGANALAHGINSEAIDDQFVQLMVDNEVTYIPTLAVYHNHHEEKHHGLISSQKALLATTHEKLQHCLFENVPSPSKWSDRTWQAKGHAYDNIRKLHKAGVNIGAGSDAGNPYTLHGTGLHNELAALSKAGLSNAQVINAATINAAKTLNQTNKLGRLAQGYEATFILLANNPLDNIENIHQISEVYKAGEFVERAKLVAQNKTIEPMGKACHETFVAKKASAVIDDFTGDSSWQAMSDSVMGGESKTTLKAGEDYLAIKTAVGKTTNFGAWAGSEIKFNSPVDASTYKGVTITYKGSNVPFSMSLYHSDVKDWDHFSVMLKPTSEWKTIKLPFENFRQYGFGNKVEWSAKQLVGINLMWRKMPGASADMMHNELEVKELSYF